VEVLLKDIKDAQEGEMPRIVKDKIQGIKVLGKKLK